MHDYLGRNSLFHSRALEEFKSNRVRIRAPRYAWTFAYFELSVARLIYPGVVGGMVCIDGESRVSIDRVARSPRPAEANFLLNRSHSINPNVSGQSTVLTQQPQSLSNNETADLIVKPAPGRTIFQQHLELGLKRHDVAEPNERVDLCS